MASCNRLINALRDGTHSLEPVLHSSLSLQVLARLLLVAVDNESALPVGAPWPDTQVQAFARHGARRTAHGRQTGNASSETQTQVGGKGKALALPLQPPRPCVLVCVTM